MVLSRNGTLPEAVRAAALTHPETPVVFAGGDGAERRVSLVELVSDAERVAGFLQESGVRPGDVVAVALPGSYDGAVASAAVALTGAVLLPVVLIYGRRELEFIVRQSRARAVIARETVEVPPVPLLLTPSSLQRSVPAAPVAVAPDDRALIVYTSGTTAEPKGVQHSHRSLMAEVMSPALHRPGDTGVRQLAMFPPGHVAGLLGLLKLLVHGAPTVVLEAWDPARAARLIDAHDLTSTAGAPVQLAGLLDARDRGEASLATMRDFLTGAAAVPPALVRRAAAAGVTAYRSYGSSEHPTVSCGHPDDDLEHRARTDGRVQPGNEVRIVDEEGRDATEGELLTRGPELFLGYVDSALDEEAFSDGWFHTGDIGMLDPDGFLTITDRKKDIIIRGGENLSSKEIEDILLEHPRISEAAVVGVPDERLGERACAIVVLREGTLTLTEVHEHFRLAGVARQKTPESLRLRDTLPRTPAGKVQKFLLREEVARDSG
ncbi:MAG: fadK 1 [Frankiales bacterium]|nr:fadK 1 [Frankiales bacterium]